MKRFDWSRQRFSFENSINQERQLIDRKYGRKVKSLSRMLSLVIIYLVNS